MTARPWCVYNAACMAKTVRISLGTKLRVLFAAAVAVIIFAALAVPWYFTERLVENAAENTAAQVARLALAEWAEQHQQKPRPDSALARQFTSAGGGRRGPIFVPLTTKDMPTDNSLRQAVKSFRGDKKQLMAMESFETKEGLRLYRYFRAVRADNSCRHCHDGAHASSFQPNQLVGVIDMTMPPSTSSLIWWTRGVFLFGGILAAFLAFVVFYVITKQTVLGPIRRLRQLSDKVAEGDLGSRSHIATGDEFERLGKSFNEMLDAIQRQQDQLRQANRALDLRLGELAETNVSLFEANRIKNEFLANVSHELRTPLNSIMGFAELLSETDDERRKRHATNILTSARLLLGIINDLLEVARIEAGKIEVRNEKTSISDVCETLAQLVRPLADKKDLALSVLLQPEMPMMTTDGRKVQQILYNLLSNAIKFTPPSGQVTLSARVAAAEQSPLGKESVLLAVADTGPGIAAADQERIFQKFSRLDSPLTREHSGTGLGLSISRDLTNLLGGKLTLESEPGKGATFSVWLPTEPPEQTPPAAKA